MSKIDYFSQKKIFQKSATAILCIFMFLMVAVTVAAYSRTSGSTKQDMSKAAQLRRQTTE